MAKTMSLESKSLREYICRIPYDSDLLSSLKESTGKLQIRSGWFNLIGALRCAKLLYYLQDEKRFVENSFDGPLEISSAMGNIATFDEETIIHCHVVLADKKGACYGGHLAAGTRVFAVEAYIKELSPPVKRKFDPQTGLNLFDI
jgi:hypothetical protein